MRRKSSLTLLCVTYVFQVSPKKKIDMGKSCLSFHKTYIKLQFYFPLWLMFKYFAIHVFFTPVWDFTSVFLRGMKSDRREVLLRRQRVNNTRSLCWAEVSSLHFTTDCRSEIIRVTTPLTMPVRACLPVYKMYVLHVNLSTLVHYKVIINIQCVQVKCISSLFATNLNDFNTHLFGQTVWYSASPSLNV